MFSNVLASDAGKPLYEDELSPAIHKPNQDAVPELNLARPQLANIEVWPYEFPNVLNHYILSLITTDPQDFATLARVNKEFYKWVKPRILKVPDYNTNNKGFRSLIDQTQGFLRVIDLSSSWQISEDTILDMISKKCPDLISINLHFISSRSAERKDGLLYGKLCKVSCSFKLAENQA